MREGVRDFAARLAKVPNAVRLADSKAVAANAAEWVRVSRATAPKDPEDGTPLHDSIRNEPSATGGQIVSAGGPTTTKDGYDYALAQEFGTSSHQASPFFWPVYRSFRKRWASRRSRAVSAAIKGINNGQ